MDLSKTIAGIAENAANFNAPTAGDYIGADGLLYCGKCHTPKQCKVNFGSEITVYCMCKCKTDAYNRKAEEDTRRKFLEHISDARNAAFTSNDLRKNTFDLDDGSLPDISKIARNYAKNFKKLLELGQGLLFYGSCGTGKTFMASCIANAVIDHGYTALVTNFSYLSNTINASFDKKTEVINNLGVYHLLVIDDLGAERQSDFMQETVYNIIDARYRAGMPMIITTNLDIEQLKNPQSTTQKRIYDRILERCTPIKVDGKNRRYQRINQNHNTIKDLLGM